LLWRRGQPPRRVDPIHTHEPFPAGPAACLPRFGSVSWCHGRSQPLHLGRGTMSLLLKAFPHGRPRPRAPRALLVLTLLASLVLLTVPLGEAAQAGSKHHATRATHAKH